MHITQCNNLPMTCLKKESRKIYIIHRRLCEAHRHTPLPSGCAPCGLKMACWLEEHPGCCVPSAYVVCAPQSAPYTLTAGVTMTLHLCWTAGCPSAFFLPPPHRPSEEKNTKTNPKRNFLNTSLLKSFILIMTQTHTNVHTGWVYAVGQWRTG